MDGAAMFDLGDTNLLLPLVRGVFVAALFSAFGARCSSGWLPRRD